MAPIYEKDKITKEYIKTQKVINTPNFISQLEPSAPKEILVKSKMRTDVYILTGVTRESVTPEMCITGGEVILNHLQCLLQERIQFQIKTLTD